MYTQEDWDFISKVINTLEEKGISYEDLEDYFRKYPVRNWKSWANV